MIAPYLKILRKRNFFLIFLGQFFSQFGDRLTLMALIGLFPGSIFGLTKVFTLSIIPVFLISPVAGVYIDRWNKRKTMYITDLLRGIFILSLPFILVKYPSLIPIYTLVFLSFCIGRFFLPAKMTIIPSIVKQEDLFIANSLVSLTAMVTAILGLGIGGIIVEKWGVRTAFFLDAITFFLSALCMIFVKIEEKVKFTPKDIIQLGKEVFDKVKNSVIFEIKEGIRYIIQSSETRYASRIKVILFAIIGSLSTIFIVFIQTTFNTVTQDLGWLAISAIGGLFTGTLIYGKFAHKMSVRKTINLSLIFSCLWMAILVSFLKFYPSKIFACIACAILGIICSPIEIALITLIHKESKDNFMGRVFSSLEVIMHLAFLIFMYITSYTAQVTNPFTVIMSISIIGSVLAFFSLWRENYKEKHGS